MISLMIPPGHREQISRVSKMLNEEAGTATCIKSRVTRLSVISAIVSCRERLKRYNDVPKNGLVIYSGQCEMGDGKEKKITMDFEPFKPISNALYLCDNKFHTEVLRISVKF